MNKLFLFSPKRTILFNIMRSILYLIYNLNKILSNCSIDTNKELSKNFDKILKYKYRSIPYLNNNPNSSIDEMIDKLNIKINNFIHKINKNNNNLRNTLINIAKICSNIINERKNYDYLPKFIILKILSHCDNNINLSHRLISKKYLRIINECNKYIFEHQICYNMPKYYVDQTFLCSISNYIFDINQMMIIDDCNGDIYYRTIELKYKYKSFRDMFNFIRRNKCIHLNLNNDNHIGAYIVLLIPIIIIIVLLSIRYKI